MATQIFVVSGTTQVSPADWNNANNTVEAIGGGASGAAAAGTFHATGGGGGEYRAISNFNVLIPGTTSFVYVIGAGGLAATTSTTIVGNNGAQTTFNVTDLVAKPGLAGAVGTGSQTGGAGGTGGTGAADNADGGKGGDLTGASGSGGSGAGGAGGSTGAGGAGVDSSSTSAGVFTDGGAGDAGAGGAAGTTGGTRAGGAGAEWDATHGSGGGGAGDNAIGAVGDGGLYGGGGGAVRNAVGSPISGAGAQGIVVLTYTVASVGHPTWKRFGGVTHIGGGPHNFGRGSGVWAAPKLATIIFDAALGAVRRIVCADTQRSLALASIPGVGEDRIVVKRSEIAWLKQGGMKLPRLADCTRLVAEMKKAA